MEKTIAKSLVARKERNAYLGGKERQHVFYWGGTGYNIVTSKENHSETE